MGAYFEGMRVAAKFTVSSEPGNERFAAERVRQILTGVEADDPQLDRLQTAVAEATLNAMEHGNHFQPDSPVLIRVEADDNEVRVSVTDGGRGAGSPYEEPDLDRKLAGLQSPRGSGLFLIREMVDSVSDEVVAGRQTVHLSVRLKPGQVAS